MHPFQLFRKQCEELCGENARYLEEPKEHADLALPCFRLGKNPTEIAKQLEQELKQKIKKESLVGAVEASGPYLNFYIDGRKFSRLAVAHVLRERDGYGSGEKKKEKIILEHTSMNPSGPVHVGRLRNSIIGDTLRRLFLFSGYGVETHYYVNDMGKQIAIIAWGLSNVKPDAELMQQYHEYSKKPDFRTMFYYVTANAEVEKDARKMDAVDELLRKCEAGDKKSLAKLKKVAKDCVRGQTASLEKLGIKFDKFDYESRFVETGAVKKLVETLSPWLTKEHGAVGVDLSKRGLRKFVPLLKKDGTSVYTLRDAAYHLEKAKNFDKLINVLGEDHKIEFQELKTMLEEFLEIKKELVVVHYSFVNFVGMRLSTRKGQTAPLDALIDEGLEKAVEEIKKRGFLKSGVDKMALEIVKAAVRYNIIKTDLHKGINFIWEDALNFEGDTGPYLQYTYARANSILRRSKKKPKTGELFTGMEHDLAKKISRFPEVIEKAVSDLKPHYIAGYLYELASVFNQFYHETRVIGTKEERSRLALVTAVAQVMENGLAILGIKALEKM